MEIWLSLGLLLLVVVLLISAVKVVPAARTLVVERGGARRTLTPGVHLLVPFLDRARGTVDMREQALRLSGVPVVARDRLVVRADGEVMFRVVDPVAFTQGETDHGAFLERLVVDALRRSGEPMDSEDLRAALQAVASDVRSRAGAESARRGIQIDSVRLREQQHTGVGEASQPHH
ncbi:SPFH domain-containing protein [Georgenia alba]|uniref:SPFH domain-containing protein n=1 Tax=Georgenia alba TaxID=2233858 RepID=A0ABW2QCY5_9MICO